MLRLLAYLFLIALALLIVRAIAPVLIVALAGLLILAWKRPAVVSALTGRRQLARVPPMLRATPMRFAASTAVVGLALIGASSAVGGESPDPAPAAVAEVQAQPEDAETVATASPTAHPTAEPTPRATPRATPRPTAKPTVAPMAFTEAAGPTGPTEVGTVVDVTDGDTIKVNIGGSVFSVRYIGIDTPELGSGVEPFALEAEAANAVLLSGQQVVLEKDVSETDRFGRLLRYVWIQGSGGWLLVNLELLRLGMAEVTTFPPDVKYVDNAFLPAQRASRTAQVGLWGSAPLSAATPAPLVASTPVPVVAAPVPAVPVAVATPVPFVAPAPVVVVTPAPVVAAPAPSGCELSYPDICIPVGVADINCPAMYAQGISMFRVRWDVPNPDPHGFDGEGDGWGCEG